jgi:hypothetical protein
MQLDFMETIACFFLPSALPCFDIHRPRLKAAEVNATMTLFRAEASANYQTLWMFSG